MFLGVVERLRNQLSGTFADLTGTLDRSYPYILAGLSGTFADVFGRADRMQRHQVTGSFADSFSSFACTLACPFADVTAAASDITAGASSLGWSCGLGLGGLGLRGRHLSRGRILTVSGKAKNQRCQK
jgi:hypothetical protein